MIYIYHISYIYPIAGEKLDPRLKHCCSPLCYVVWLEYEDIWKSIATSCFSFFFFFSVKCSAENNASFSLCVIPYLDEHFKM